jgi:hypothetical protein
LSAKHPLIPKFFQKFFGEDFSIRELLIGAQQATQGILFFEALIFTGGIRVTHSRPVAFSGSCRCCRELILFVAGWGGAAVAVVKALFCSATQSSINYSNQTPLDKGKGVGIFKVVIKIVAKGILDKK